MGWALPVMPELEDLTVGERVGGRGEVLELGDLIT